jgi:hypothetical protein
MRFATVWKYYQQQWFQNTNKEVKCVVTVVLSHQIDDVESIDSPSNGQDEFLGPDVLLHLLRDIISRCAAFRRMMTSSVRTRLGVQKVMITVFLTSTTLIVNEALPKGRKFNQKNSISPVLPELVKEKRRLLRRKRGPPFLIQCDVAGLITYWTPYRHEASPMNISDLFQYSTSERLLEMTGSRLGIQERQFLRLFVKPSRSRSQICFQVLTAFETFF